MTKEDLESVRYLKAELTVLEQRIKNPTTAYMRASIKHYKKRKLFIMAKLWRIERAIHSLKDPELTAILEGVYFARMTQQQIAFIIHTDQSTVSRKLNQYLNTL